MRWTAQVDSFPRFQASSERSAAMGRGAAESRKSSSHGGISMSTFVMLTRLSTEALKRPAAVTELNKHVEDRIRQECPTVKWIANYAVLGPCDYLDIFEAPDTDTAAKVALLVRSFGHATTEIWVATAWDRFAELAKGLK
jgi:uncharacterized protein with GYD domain